jgi:hypothetical protein
MPTMALQASPYVGRPEEWLRAAIAGIHDGAVQADDLRTHQLGAMAAFILGQDLPVVGHRAVETSSSACFRRNSMNVVRTSTQ